MIMMLSLLAGVAGQPVVFRPAPPLVIMGPAMLTSYTAPLPPLPEGAEPAVRATANLPALFSTDDYPAAARREGQQGTVAFAVAIDRAGRVTACSITQPSGSVSLDWATCSIISRRARFTPARDVGGRAVEDRARGRIRWVLPPQPLIPFADHKMAMVFTIDAADAVAKCRVEGPGKALNNDRLCAGMMTKARSIAAEAAKVIAITNRELVLEQGVLVGGPDRTRNVAAGAGETRGTLFALVLEINPAGNVSYCAGADGAKDSPRVAAACRDSIKAKFVALDPAAGDQSTRQAVRYWASYTRPID